MKRPLFLALWLLMGLSVVAKAEAEYPFQEIYANRKAKLKILPAKTIERTLYCAQMNRIDEATRLTSGVGVLRADRIVVSKARKKLYLLSAGQLINEYDVAFGFGAGDGPKAQQGDGRTPEGLYKINLKKTRTNYHLALQVSYPEKKDRDFAAQNQVSAGGDILVHGFPSSPVDFLIPDQMPQIHPRIDWTQGCIGLTNPEIEEIYSLVRVGTDIEICPMQSDALQDAPNALD